MAMLDKEPLAEFSKPCLFQIVSGSITVPSGASLPWRNGMITIRPIMGLLTMESPGWQYNRFRALYSIPSQSSTRAFQPVSPVPIARQMRSSLRASLLYYAYDYTALLS